MSIGKLFFFLVIALALSSCQAKQDKVAAYTGAVKPKKSLKVPESSSLNSSADCTITTESEKLKNELFPSEFKNFDAAKLKKYFSKNTTVDSMKHNNDGYHYWEYQFKEGSSLVSFFVKPKESGEPWFYLNESKIDRNLINFKNGIKIGMFKKDVFQILGVNQLNCDTLHFQEGDLFTYYDFLFQDNKLVKIYIIPSE